MRDAVLARAAGMLQRDAADLHLDGDKIVDATGEVLAGLADVLG